MTTEDPTVPIALPPGAGISFSQRLFSEEIAMADAMGGQTLDTKETAYEFSNGRRFVDGG